MAFWPGFVVAALAVWRVTHLLAREDGPGMVLARLRTRLSGRWAGLMDCFHCLSLWVAAPPALAVPRPIEPGWSGWLLVWLALSGVACLLERLHGEPVVIERFVEEQGDVDGMLRAETRSAAERVRADAA
ncbi:MAG: hypothetical protein ACREF3_17075 [Acetobacteraceae bacterium]